MKLNISQETTIYIMAPANIDTGGPKDLHQLGFELKSLGKKVFMYYFPEGDENPINENYKIYNLPFTNEIKDSEENILIIPEINTTIQLSRKYKKIQKALWWLSLDFFFITNFHDSYSKFFRSILKIPFNLINLFNKISKNAFGNLSLPRYLKFIYLMYPFSNTVKLEDMSVNFSQSEYQYKVLKTKKVNSLLLTDYIRDEYFEAESKILIKNKKNMICYNPRKSSSFMKKIIRDNSNIKFIPLIDYNMNELIKILSESKIYMDFGFHPGADHLPREAAILKNCVITNKEGSAFYFDSLSINKEFKFEEKKKNLIEIKKKILHIFENFEDENSKFDNYRIKLNNQKKNFSNQVKSIFSL